MKVRLKSSKDAGPWVDKRSSSIRNRCDMKAAIAGVQRHWAELAQPVGDPEDKEGIRANARNRRCRRRGYTKAAIEILRGCWAMGR